MRRVDDATFATGRRDSTNMKVPMPDYSCSTQALMDIALALPTEVPICAG
jgi:hypothetical protein